MNSSVADLIADLIAIEGGYSNDPDDSGGETTWGVTERRARKFGYTGPMIDMPPLAQIGLAAALASLGTSGLERLIQRVLGIGPRGGR